MKQYNIKIKDYQTHTTFYETVTTIENGVMVLPYRVPHTNRVAYQYLTVQEFSWSRNQNILVGRSKLPSSKYIVVKII